jgi:hypothetical protein
MVWCTDIKGGSNRQSKVIVIPVEILYVFVISWYVCLSVILPAISLTVENLIASFTGLPTPQVYRHYPLPLKVCMHHSVLFLVPLSLAATNIVLYFLIEGRRSSGGSLHIRELHLWSIAGQLVVIQPLVGLVIFYLSCLLV